MTRGKNNRNGLMLRPILFGLLLITHSVIPPRAHGQAGSLLRIAREELIDALGRFAARRGVTSATSELVEVGGEVAVGQLARRLANSGGDDAIRSAAHLVTRHGPVAIRAMENSPSPSKLLAVLESLPEEQVAQFLPRLNSGLAGKELSEAIVQHGVRAIELERLATGLAEPLLRVFGSDAIAVVQGLSRDELRTLAPHLNDMALLPIEQRRGIGQLIQRDKDRFLGFVGGFVKANPGKVLFTAATTSLVLAYPDSILGADELVFDAEGTPVVVTRPGLVGRGGAGVSELLLQPVSRSLNDWLWLITGAITCVGLVRIGWWLSPFLRRSMSPLSARDTSSRGPKSVSTLPIESVEDQGDQRGL